MSIIAQTEVVQWNNLVRDTDPEDSITYSGPSEPHVVATSQPTLTMPVESAAANSTSQPPPKPVRQCPSAVRQEMDPKNTTSVTSVTSVSVFSFSNKEKRREEEERREEGEELEERGYTPETLTDVTDVGKHAGGRVTDADGRVTDADGRALLIKGTLRLRQLHQGGRDLEVLPDPDLRSLLARQETPEDTMIVADNDTRISFLEINCPTDSTPPAADVLAMHIGAIYPAPSAWWFSHGGGATLVYKGGLARAHALGAALSVPRPYGVEVQDRTRHPASVSSAPRHEGRRCGPVQYPQVEFPAVDLNRMGMPDVRTREQAMTQLDMRPGSSYGHAKCPIEPDASPSDTACVYALDHGIFCRRCAAQGKASKPWLPPGLVPYIDLIPGSATVVAPLVAGFVHWTHAQYVLSHYHPNLDVRVLKDLYSELLQMRHGNRDQRVIAVFDPKLCFVRTSGGWADSASLEPTVIDNDALDALPAVQFRQIKPVRVNNDQKKEPQQPDGAGVTPSPVAGNDQQPASAPGPEYVVKTVTSVDRLLRSNAKNGRSMPGYIPLRPVRGFDFPQRGDTSETIPVRLKASSPVPFDLPATPLSRDEIEKRLLKAFPGLDLNCLRSCVAAVICAQVVGGQPKMLAIVGPSGAGKTQIARLAASITGDTDATMLQLNADSKEFLRALGVAAESGRKLMLFDEISRTPNLARLLGQFLQLGATVRYRPHYENEHETPLRSAFVMTSPILNDKLQSAPEFCRRVYVYHLYRRADDWARTCGGDVAGWRHRSPENAVATNSLVAEVYALCQQHDFDFAEVADLLGANRADAEAEGALTPEVARAIYRFVRGDTPGGLLLHTSTFAKGWFDLTKGPLGVLINETFALDTSPEAKDLIESRERAKTNLMSVAWADVLGLPDRRIQCRVKIHGKGWGIRFEESTGRRGTELINDKLPPIPEDSE